MKVDAMKGLLAQELLGDPRIAEAKKLLLAAVADHAQSITGIRPPDPDAQAHFRDTLEQFGEIRGGPLYYPYLGSGIGRGPLVELADGSVKYDMISGIGVHYLGHSHPALIAAGIDAALRDTIMQGNLQQNAEAIAVSQSLLALANRNNHRLAHCFLTTSGAMANENAIKLLFQKRSPAHRILAFDHAFAGRTLAMSQITDKPAYRAGLPSVLAVDYVPFFDFARPAESTAEAVETLQRHLARYPGQHAAMCLELVLGEGGYYPGDRAFFTAIMEVLNQHGVAVWVDEIQTFGRTSQPFAFQHFELDAYVDVVTVGKLTQVCATLYRDEYKPKPGLISQTFTGSTSALFAARAILDLMRQDGLFGSDGRIETLHRHFAGRLQAMADQHPDWIRGPFGLGAMIACSVFDGNDQPTKKFLQALFQNGVIAFVAGAAPARVRFLMPVPAISEPDIDIVCDIIEKTLADRGTEWNTLEHF
jgi:4-aminobutyrate aminotransferase-like enzyme